MTNPPNPRRVEVRDDNRTVAAAEVAASGEAGGTARASLHAESGHVPPGKRTDLVDAVMDLPEVQASARLEAAVPIGDGESLERLRQRTTGKTMARSLVATRPDRDQGRHVRVELRSLASGAVWHGACGKRPAGALRGCLLHCRAQQQLLPVAAPGGVWQLASQIARRLPAVGQGAPGADPWAPPLCARDLAGAHRGGLARAG